MTDVVDEVARARQELREAGRRALGVTGVAEEVPPLRRAVADVGWYPLIAISLLVMVDQFQGYGVSVLGPEISNTLGISKTVLALLIAIKYLVVMIASLPMAALVQRRARRASLAVWTGLGWALTTLFTGFVINAWGLFAMLLGDGASTGSVQALHAPLLLDTYRPEARMRVLSAYQAAAAFGSVLAPLVVGLFAVLGFTWRGVFFMMGVLCVLGALFASRLKDPGFGQFDSEVIRAAVRPEAEDTEPAGEVELGFWEVVRRIVLIPTIRRLFIAWAVLGTLVFPLITYLFFFLAGRWHEGPGARSLFFAAMSAVSIPGLLWWGRRGETLFREDPARLIRGVSVVLVGISIGLGVAVAVPVFALMCVAFAVVFSGAALLTPALGMVQMTLVPPAYRPHSAAVGGIFFAGIGGVGGLVLLSGLDKRWGIAGAVAALAIPGLISALVLRGAARTVNDDLDRMVDGIIETEELNVLRREGVHLPMLACRHIDFAYGNLQVLFDVDFTVDDGEMVALLGTNGSGKSTLLRVISGLGLPTRGSVNFRGADITYLDAERRLGLGIAQVPGGKAVFGRLSVVDNLRIFGYSEGRDRRAVERGIDATFEAFPRLAERRHNLASTLSGGEQQMLGLGKALIVKPRLLLIDELSLGLAPRIVGELLAMVRRINAEGTAVVLVEQSVNIALSLVQHAYFMEKGEVRFDGPSAELLQRTDLLRSVFLKGAGAALK